MWELPSTYPALCLKDILAYPKIRVLTSGILSRTPDLWKILPQHIDRRNVLSTKLDKGGRSEREKLDRRRSTVFTVPHSHHTNRQALSTARLRHAGLLATADEKR